MNDHIDPLTPDQPPKPVSDAKLRANRENAKRSTGPKTEDGKKRSSLNSIRHGLTGQVHVTTDEEMAVYLTFCNEYFDEWKPVGPTEKNMVQTLADDQWQIHRASTLMFNLQPNDDGDLAGDQSQKLDRYSRHASRFKRDFEKTLKLLEARQKDRKDNEKQDLRGAAMVHDMFCMLGQKWDPPEFGFVSTIPKIEAYIHRRNIKLDAMIALKVGYDRKQFNKELGIT